MSRPDFHEGERTSDIQGGGVFRPGADGHQSPISEVVPSDRRGRPDMPQPVVPVVLSGDSQRSDTAMPEVVSIGPAGQEPTIAHVGKVSLIGVSHETDLTQHKPSQAFIDVVGAADYLLLEGSATKTSDTNTVVTHERVAADTFIQREKEADIRFLEEGVDFAALAEQYDLAGGHYVSFEQYLYAYRALDTFVQQYGPNDVMEFKDVLSRIMGDNAVSAYPNLPEDDVRSKIDHLVAVDAGLVQSGDAQKRNGLIFAAWHTNNRFLAPVRDHEILYPRIRRYDETLPGQKAVVIGDLHGAPIKHALENGRMDKPHSWRSFRKGLDGFAGSSHDLFDDVIVRENTVKPWYKR